MLNGFKLLVRLGLGDLLWEPPRLRVLRPAAKAHGRAVVAAYNSTCDAIAALMDGLGENGSLPVQDVLRLHQQLCALKDAALPNAQDDADADVGALALGHDLAGGDEQESLFHEFRAEDASSPQSR